MRPYYESGGITVYQGDCRSILPELRGDVILTDPPYNCGKNYGDGTNDRREWPDWCAWWDECMDVMIGACPDVLATLSQTAYKQYLRLGRHDPAWTAIWYKPLALSVCAAPFLPHWEPIVYWGKQRHRKGKGGAVFGSDVFVANVETGQARWGHPTPKPLALMRQLVARFPVDTVVIDPFAGSGTTLRAAKDLGRRAIGVEIEEVFCDTIVRRMGQEVMALELPA